MQIKSILTKAVVVAALTTATISLAAAQNQSSHGDEAPTKIALIAVGPTVASNVVAAAEATLSDDSNIELLERDAIDQVLNERRLSLSGLVETSRSGLNREWFDAQLLVIVEAFSVKSNSRNQLVASVTAFDAHTGVCLSDQKLPERQVEQWADVIVAAIQSAREKRSRIETHPDDALTICVQEVRSVNLPEQHLHLRDSVDQVLQRQLVNVRGAVLLQRQHLERISQERQLSGISKSLLASSVLVKIDLEVGEHFSDAGAVNDDPADRGKDESLPVVATIQLSNASGETRFNASVETKSTDASELADRIALTIADGLKTDLTGDRDRVAEAHRFVRSANYFFHRHDPRRAKPFAEAALALCPDDEKVLDTAATILFESAMFTIAPQRHPNDPIRGPALRCKSTDLEHALRTGQRALDVRRRLYQRLISTDGSVLREFRNLKRGWSNQRLIQPNFRCDWVGPQFFETVLAVHPSCHRKTTQHLLSTLQREARYLELELIDRQARSQVKDAEGLRQYSNWLRVLMRQIPLMSPDAKTYAELTAQVQSNWLRLFDQFGYFDDPAPTINLIFAANLNRQTQLDAIEQTGQWHFRHRDCQRLKPLYQTMSEHDDPALALIGQIGMAWIELSQKGENRELAKCRQLIEQAFETLDLIDGVSALKQREIGYLALCDFVELAPENSVWRSLMKEVRQQARKRNHFVVPVHEALFELNHAYWNHYREFRYKSLMRGNWRPFVPESPAILDEQQLDLDALDDPDVVVVGGSRREAWARLHHLHELRRELYERYSDAEDHFRHRVSEKPPTPWKGSSALLSLDQYPEIWAFGRPALDDRALYVVGIGKSRRFANGFMQLFRVDLTSRKITVSERHEFPMSFDQSTRLNRLRRPDFLIPRYACCALVRDGHVFVQTIEHGLWVYDAKTLAKLAQLDRRDGLPANDVQSIAQTNDRLWANVGYAIESHIVEIDPASLESRVVSSSMRSVASTQLDDLQSPVEVAIMLSDDSSNRIWMSVESIDHLTGLWVLDGDTGKLTNRRMSPTMLNWASLSSKNTYAGILVDDTSQWVCCRFDLEKRKFWLMRFNDDGSLAGEVEMNHQTTLTDDMRLAVQPPYLVRGDWLYFGQPFGRMSLTTGQYECFSYFDLRPGSVSSHAWRNHLQRWRDFIPVSNGFLVTTEDGIWRLEF